MNYKVYYNRYNQDKTKFTDIITISKLKLQKLSSLPWITISKVIPVNEPKNIAFSVYPVNTFCIGDIDEIRPLSI